MSKVIQDKEHARLSPSGSKQWMTCPGSIRLSKLVNKPYQVNKYAAEGTVAHEVHELCLRDNKEPKDYLGQKFTADGLEFTVNQNMVDAVTESIDYIRDTESMLPEGHTVEILVEVRCSLKHLAIPGLDGGTSDVVMILRNEKGVIYLIEVVDYKHGQGVTVEPEWNTQGMCYALGALEELKIHSNVDVVITITQPRAFHSDGGIRSWNTSYVELQGWQEVELIPSANLTQSEDAPLVPSEDGCRWCDAKGSCPALHSKTQEVAMIDFEEVKLPEIELLTSDQKLLVMQYGPMIKTFIDSVSDQVTSEMQTGSEAYNGGFKLVTKATQRKLTEDATDELCSPLLDWMSEEDMYNKKPKGIGDLEKTLKEKMKAQNVKGFVKLAKEIMDDITTKPEGDIVIAPLSDKRRAVQSSAISDFSKLDK